MAGMRIPDIYYEKYRHINLLDANARHIAKKLAERDMYADIIDILAPVVNEAQMDKFERADLVKNAKEAMEKLQDLVI